MLFLNIGLFVAISISVYFYIRFWIDRKLTLESLGEKTIINRLNNYLNKREGYFSYERIEKYLKRTGNSTGLTPLGYVTVKFLCSAVLFILFSLGKGYLLGTVLTIPGFFILDFIIRKKDKEDMKKINFELKNVIDLLKSQWSAGVPIDLAITEMYLTVINKRFKLALAILSSEIAYTHDIYRALDHFLERFGPQETEIKNFVLTIRQSIQTGKAKRLLDRQSKQINKENYLLLNEEATKQIENTVDILAMLIFFGILAFMLYTLIPSLTTTSLS